MRARQIRKATPRRVGPKGRAASPRRPWDDPRFKIASLVVALGLLVVGSIAIIRWNTINRLSRQSPAMFAAEIEAAAGDGLIGAADVELLQELQTLLRPTIGPFPP